MHSIFKNNVSKISNEINLKYNITININTNMKVIKNIIIQVYGYGKTTFSKKQWALGYVELCTIKISSNLIFICDKTLQ